MSRIKYVNSLYIEAMLLVVLGTVFVFSSSALADEVRLKNGDRLTGKITRLQGGKLTIETNLEGTVVIPFENVSTFGTEDPIDLRLDDGSTLKQKVIASELDRRIEVEKSEVLGGQTISLDQVAEINPRPTQWDGSLTIGTEIDVGDTKERKYSVRFDATRRSKTDRINLRGKYNGERTKSSGDWDTTKREMEVGLQYDYFITKKTFLWAGATADKDGMSDLDLRFVSGGGLGYQWVERDDLKFNTRAGLTWVSANYSDNTEDESYIAGRLGFRFDYIFLSDFKFFTLADWISSMESRYDQLVKASAGVRTYFTSALFGEARVDWEWDSSPAQNADRQDATYLLGLGWTF